MKKSKYVKIIFFCVVLTVGLWYGRAQSQQLQPKSEQRITSDIGRDNPFAEISSKKNFISQNVPRSLQSGLESPDLFVKTVTLKFLDAKNLRTAIASMSSGHGSISVDGKSNSLIVCDTKENLEKILTQVRKADRTPEQIMVEVVILDVQLNDETEIGTDWDRIFKPERDEWYVQDLIPTASALGTGFGGFFGVTKRDLIGVVHALQEIRNVEILASPRILVASGEEAFIQTIEEIPYIELSQTSGGGAGSFAISSTKFKDAGVTLRVKATVTDDQKILMTIESEQSINTGVEGVGDSTVPIIDKRKAKTTLLMEDGQVLVMGGLRKKEIRITRNQVPLLGDLPLIGFLFANNKEEIQHSELVVFISPHIYKGEPLPEEQMAKFKELREKPLLSLPKDKEKNEKKKKNGWFGQSDKQPQGK
jgi:general secretion pathway protein D